MPTYNHDFDESKFLLSEAIEKMFSVPVEWNSQLDYAFNESTGWYFQGIVSGITCPDCLAEELMIWRDRENPYSPGCFWNTVYACVSIACGRIFNPFDLDISRRLVLEECLPRDNLLHEEQLHIAAKKQALYTELGVDNRPWSDLEFEALKTDVAYGNHNLNEYSEKYKRTFKSIRSKIQQMKFPSMGKKWHTEEEFLIEESYLAGDNIDQISETLGRTPATIYKKIVKLQEIQIDTHRIFESSERNYLTQHLSSDPLHLYDASLHLRRRVSVIKDLALNLAIDAFPLVELEPKFLKINESTAASEIIEFKGDEKVLQLSKAIYLKLGFIPAIENESNFQTDGWEYEGQIKNLPCIQCGTLTDLEIWRKQIEESKYRYWAIACSECELVSNLMDYSSELRERFRSWSSGKPIHDNESEQGEIRNRESQDLQKAADEFLILNELAKKFTEPVTPDQIRSKRSTILGHIKDSLRVNFGIEFCFIQSGAFYNAIEENAALSNELWGWKIVNESKRIPFVGVTSLSVVKAKTEELSRLGVSWAVIQRTSGVNDALAKITGNKTAGITREVIESSSEEALGFVFRN